jgi:flagellar assembly protein FliH
MNTSAKRGPDPLAAPTPKSAAAQPFPYDAVSRQRSAGFDGLAAVEQDREAAVGREAQAREQGRQQGQAEVRKTFEDLLAKERSSLAAAIEGFRKDRAAYFEKVEAEVVQLALSIARKILHREAQVDPLLLAGIAKVALEKLDGATRVTLRLHPQNAHTWSVYLAAQLQPSRMPEMVEDAQQPLDRCKLETSLGSTELGLEVQLKEIELGLMDLLAARQETSGE